MLRRFVTALTILTLVFSAILPAQLFAADDIGYEGRICRDLGILKGNTGVVDNDYLNTRPSRLQSAIMFLRLKGLEHKALSYTGGSNFKDAGVVAWKEGRNVLSYLKNHPELGWIGDGANFLPYNNIDSKAYYKVLLESLGYKQKIDGDGDFDWNSVLDYAKEKGMYKVAGTENFTVRSLAIATVEALKTKMKNSDKKLIEHLVEIGDVDKKDAIELNLYSDRIDVQIKSVRAVSNSKVEVVFEEPVGSRAEETGLYAIKKLDIKSASMKNESAVIINTYPMSESASYVLTFNSKSYSFTGLKKDSNAPKLISAECKDTDLIELCFDRVLDNETAQDTDTYSISGVGVKSAKLDSTNTKVRLTTNGIQAGHTYELKIDNIKNGDGVTTKFSRKKFTGKKDTIAPRLNKLTVLNNVKLLLEFSDRNGLNKAVAEDTDNYRITYNGGSLEVEAARVKDSDDDGLWDSIELVTGSQNSRTSYTLIIEDMVDDSVLKNGISREIKREFKGKSEDTSGPKIIRNPKVVTNTMVEIEFDDSNALDIETACDADNYDLDNDLDIAEIRIKDPNNLYSAEGRTVQLITSEMEKSESYTLEISGVQDEFGNEMKGVGSSGYKTYKFKGVAADRTPPYIIYVECLDSKTIELNFDNILDEKSAENIMNYRVDGLAIVTKAVLQGDGKTVRLTVSSLPSDRSHTITLNNIMDISGNTLSNISISVLYNGRLYDDNSPEVSHIEAVNREEVWIHFDEEVYAENAEMKASGINFHQVGSVLDDGTVVVMMASELMEDDEYKVTSLEKIWDISSNAYELESNLEFYGTDSRNDPPEVEDWDQMDVRRFRVEFSEPVLIKGNGVSGIKNPSGISIEWTAVLNPDEEDTDEAYSTIDYIAANKNIPEDKRFEFNFTDMVSDYVGLGAYDEEDDDYGDSAGTILDSYMEDDEEPYIKYIDEITRKHIQIVFNEEIREAGRYKITYEDDNGKLKTVEIERVEVDSKDKERVNIFTKTEMSDEYLYILEPLAAALDIAGNKLDIDGLEEEFYGSNIMNSDYIQGVEVLTANTLKVTKSNRIYNVNSLYELNESGAEIGENLIQGTPARVNDNVYKITSQKPLLRDVRYRITVDGIEYGFYGVLADGGLKLELQEGKITYNYMDMSKHDVIVFDAYQEKLNVEKGNSYFLITDTEKLVNGMFIYIYVERGSDIIYGTRIKVVGMSELSSSKEITSFSFSGLAEEAIGSIDNEKGTINITVPYGTDVKHLAASFKYSEHATAKVGSVEQVNGQTVNSFADEVAYTVIAEDGSEKRYTVRVKVEDSKYEKKVTSFKIKGYESEAEIDNVNGVINLLLPSGTDLTKLTPLIEISPNTTVYPESGTEMDFSGTTIYKITAIDGSTRNYTVNANVIKSSGNSIISFKFEGVKAYETNIIEGSENKIYIKLPYTADIKRLVPLLVLSENAKVTPEPGVETDFSSPVKYTVAAEDGKPRIYTVTAEKDRSPENYITYFTLPEISFEDNVKINNDTYDIDMTVPYGTDLTGIKASFECSPGARVMIEDTEQKSGETVNDFSDEVTYTVIAEDGSKAYYKVNVTVEASKYEKKITRFAFEELTPVVEGSIDHNSNDVTLQVPYGTDIKALAPRIDISDDTEVKPGSGETRDFSKPVEYKVTAPDVSSQSYMVTVAVIANSEKLIKEFGFAVPYSIGIINEAEKGISVKVPFGTDVTKLAAIFKCSDYSTVKVGSTVQTSGWTVNDFTNPVRYTVVAQDSSMQDYSVTVTVAAPDEKRMTEFTLGGLNPAVKGIIDEAGHTVSLSVPEGTDVTKLVGYFSYIGKSVEVKGAAESEWIPQVSGVTVNDYSKTIIYRITAMDDTVAEYAVTVYTKGPM